MGQLDPVQAAKRGHRLLGGAIRVAHGVGYLIQLAPEWVIDEPLLKGPIPRTSADNFV